MIPPEDLLTPEERTIKRLREAGETLNKAFDDHMGNAPQAIAKAVADWRRSWYYITGKDLGLPGEPAPPRQSKNAHSYDRTGRRR